ncbi:LuxR family transcriptional regulator [Nocardioides marinquilinus]|uniref:LuxR family transcriptional regulator n=1 Tax=Nocardioides marinquilinus TaxID=1210400 RepID=A0ABP9P7I5_9ACTN
MPRLVGRAALLEEVRGLLDGGGSVALVGPSGVGKSALLDELEQQTAARGDAEVVRCAGAPDEVALPYAAVRDLLAQCPADAVGAAMPASVADWVAAGLVAVEPTDEMRSDLAAGVHAVLEAASQRRPVLVLLDDVQWLDAESSAVLGYARRRLAGRLLVVATFTTADAATPIDVSELALLDVPPLETVEMVELLCDPQGPGLAPDVAQRVHVESGGIPALALTMAGLVGERPAVLGRPAPLPGSIERVLRERYWAQPDDVRQTLLHLALMHRPSVRDLERTGRIGAELDVRRAAEAGLVARGGETTPRFTPSALRDVIVESCPAAERAELHRRLADAARTGAQRLRHLALADPRPDAETARRLAEAARELAVHGTRDLAAELYLLAADRSPADLDAERVEWRVAAVETAAPGNHVDLVQRALADVWESPTTPAQAVRVRLAIPELNGNAVALLDEVLTGALADAGDNDLLVARVLLQRARIALMEARPHAALSACERAVEALERLVEHGGDQHELALGLTTLSVARRWTGGDHRGSLQRALELARPAPDGFLHTSPEYMAARFAFYDDRLDEAWESFLTMLAQVERGAGTDHVHVLRCLVEVGVRAGRCQEAVEYAARAARVGEEFDLDAHTSWFVAALAELVGGDVARAATLARRGAESAEEQGDLRYVQRHQIVLGQALLRSGDAQGAAESLARVRAVETERGFGDPTVNRWHADLVSALTALGRLDDAAEVLGEARYAVERRHADGGTDGVTAQLDRAEAELLIARGDLDAAVEVLDRSVKVATESGLRLDVGRALVTRGHLERRRRRVAAARAALREAHELFVSLHADTWAAQVQAELRPEPARAADDPLLERLTESEARIARAVAAGASNREIAERTYVSVKTVEATLTRIYRKLDLRSRTQLAALLVPTSPDRE